jgi:hypothetical protein
MGICAAGIASYRARSAAPCSYSAFETAHLKRSPIGLRFFMRPQFGAQRFAIMGTTPAAQQFAQQTRTYRSATLRGPSTWCIHNKPGGVRQAV